MALIKISGEHTFFILEDGIVLGFRARIWCETNLGYVPELIDLETERRCSDLHLRFRTEEDAVLFQLGMT